MPEMTAAQSNEIELPRWLPPEMRAAYRRIAEQDGEEAAAAWARREKAGGADAPLAEALSATPFVWTDDRVATLRRLLREGRTTASIAVEIGCSSRSAVLGKIHRLGLSGDRPPKPSKSIAPKMSISPVREAVRAPLEKAEADPRRGALPVSIRPVSPPPAAGVSILDVKAFQCRWPVSGLGDSIMFCAAPVKARPAGAPPCSWCATHAAKAFVPVKGRARG